MRNKKSKQIQRKSLLSKENPNLYGYDKVVENLLNIYKKGSLPNALLISGPKGIGKATLAYHFAKFLFYNDSTKKIHNNLFSEDFLYQDLFIPVTSPVFSKVAMGGHPDLLVLGANNNDILVDDSRKISSFLHLTSTETKYRIIIVDSIDDMNINAMNALLKLLEEPPTNALFLLISHSPGKILPTIKSRCRHIKINGFSHDVAKEILFSIDPDISSSDAEDLLSYSANSPGIAYDLFLNNGLEIFSEVKNLFNNFPKVDMIYLQKLGEKASGKTNDTYWWIVKIAIRKIISDSITYNALGKNFNLLLNKKINDEAKLLVAIDIEKLLRLWEEMNKLFEQENSLHLERKAILVRLFSII